MKANYHLISEGKLERDENTIYFINAKGKRPIPIENIKQMYCHGPTSITSQVLHLFAMKGVNLHFFNYYGHYEGSFYPKQSLVSGEMVVRQAEHYLDGNKRLTLAKKFVHGAIDNMRRTIAEYKLQGKDEELLALSTEIELTKTTTELMNVEARARICYYDCFDQILQGDLKFEKRTRQPPENEINAMISFGNHLLYSTTLAEIYQTQLNPTISYLHEPSERRFSLSLDISELFKPLIVDRLIFYLINKRIIQKSDFNDDLNGILFTENGRKIFLKYYEEKISTKIKHRTLKRQVSYQHLIRLEGYKLIKHLIGAKEYTPFVHWW